MRSIVLLLAVCVLGSGACSREEAPMAVPAPRVSSEPFGRTPEGTSIELITLRNQKGIEARVMTYGGIMLSLKTPDRDGQSGDIILGFDAAAGYMPNSSFQGALIGRYGNRIAKGKFALDGKTYTLATNNAPNHLHGGARGWNQAVWHAEPFQNGSSVGVALTHTSPDGDEGYPGAVKAKVTYTLTDEGALVIDYEATTDKPTIINLTQHNYYDLSAGRATDILGHELTLHADKYTPVDETLIPTGVIGDVAGTPFDFRTPRKIGERIGDKDEQLARGKGYDHNFVLRRTGAGLAPAARVVESTSGRTMEISTTEPGIQFYSGNFLDGTLKGKGRTYNHRGGFCLETQHYPDSPNQPAFPSTTLRPGETYKSQTVHTFGVAR